MSNHHFHRSAGPFTILHVGSRLLHVEPPILHVRRTPAFSRGFFASRTAFFACRLTFFACRAANPTRPPHPSIFQRFFCIWDSLFCMSAHVFACRPNVSPGLEPLWLFLYVGGAFCAGVLVARASLCVVFIGVPDFWSLPVLTCPTWRGEGVSNNQGTNSSKWGPN